MPRVLRPIGKALKGIAIVGGMVLVVSGVLIILSIIGYHIFMFGDYVDPTKTHDGGQVAVVLYVIALAVILVGTAVGLNDD